VLCKKWHFVQILRKLATSRAFAFFQQLLLQDISGAAEQKNQ
jgi:hypothetical protein